MLATVLDPHFGSGSGSEPNRSQSGRVSNASGLPGFGPGQQQPSNRTGQVLAGFYPDRTYTRGFLAGWEPDRGSICTVPARMPVIKYLSSDRIVT